jgi:hypothetical protein
MKKACMITAMLIWLGLCPALPASAGTTGSKFFGCIKMQWQVPAGQSRVQIEFLRKGEVFGSLFLSPQEYFRQFSFSAESVFIEGRMRVKYDQQTPKGMLRADSITYRCYSPTEQSFSGQIAEFDLPENLP